MAVGSGALMAAGWLGLSASPAGASTPFCTGGPNTYTCTSSGTGPGGILNEPGGHDIQRVYTNTGGNVLAETGGSGHSDYHDSASAEAFDDHSGTATAVAGTGRRDTHDHAAAYGEFGGTAISTAGTGNNDHYDRANSYATFGGFASATAGIANGDSHDFASAFAVRADAIAISGLGDNNRAVASFINFGGTGPALAMASAGEGDHNLASATGEGGGGLVEAEAGEGDHNTAAANVTSAAPGLLPAGEAFADAGRGHNNTADAGALSGEATAEAGQGDGNQASATAVAGGVTESLAGDGDHNQANTEGFGVGGDAIAVATSSGGFADASSDLGGGAVATSSSGETSVSIDGQGLTYG